MRCLVCLSSLQTKDKLDESFKAPKAIEKLKDQIRFRARDDHPELHPMPIKRWWGLSTSEMASFYDSAPHATDALMLMAITVNSSWKVALGHFLINGLSDTERTNIVKTFILKLHDMDVQVILLTAMARPVTSQC
ncbi:THAP domain-containing protein 9 [Plakobranchus ocellatus]|uniref:THAP domain-containing protein 9 n=1 Tax=Plakobranchus ocellatus TaxID=259542 RepID=A0AAV4ADV7_9GAST|nr:THAP domain-containing protein 9 [Plakobranchus ocellatus]